MTPSAIAAATNQDSRTMHGVAHWRLIVTAAVVGALPLVAGCAVYAAAQAVTLVAALPSGKPHWVETNRAEFAYRVDDVYEQLVQGLERGGRKILEKDATTRTLLVFIRSPF